MANSVPYQPAKQAGNGITKDVPFSYKIYDENALIVVIEDAEGVQTIKTLNTDYTVTFDSSVDGTGGTVHFITAPPIDTTAIVGRKVSTTQPASYRTSPGFDAKEVEKSFDKNSMIIQDLNYDIQRSIKVKLGSAVLDLIIPDPAEGKALKWEGNELINSDTDIDNIQTYVDQAAASAAIAQAASGSIPGFTDNAGFFPRVKNTEDGIEYYDVIGYIDDAINAIPPSVFESALLHIQDQKSAGTNGGTFTSGAWRTRDLNTILTNEITGASLNANAITLPAGTYYCTAEAPAYNVMAHKIKLRKTNGTAADLPLKSRVGASATGFNDWSKLSGRFILTEQSTIELQHYCYQTQADYGLGFRPYSIESTVEVYSSIEIWKVA